MPEISRELFSEFVELLKTERGQSRKYLTEVLIRISNQAGITLTTEEIREIIDETFQELSSQ